MQTPFPGHLHHTCMNIVEILHLCTYAIYNILSWLLIALYQIACPLVRNKVLTRLQECYACGEYT